MRPPGRAPWGGMIVSAVAPYVQQRDGELFVGDSQVTLQSIIANWQRGIGPEHIQESFPSLPTSAAVPRPSPTAMAAMRTTEPAARLVSTRVCRTLGGATSARSPPFLRTRPRAPGSEWKRPIQRTCRWTVQAVANGSTRACPCARTSVCTHVCLHALRPHPRPRSERGQEYSMARAAPSGSPGVGGGAEPRTRGV